MHTAAAITIDASTIEPGRIQVVDVDVLVRSATNPRTHFDEAYIGGLGASIKAKGLIHPLVVRTHPKQAGKFEIVAGECRYRGAKHAGVSQLPVIVRDLSDAEVLETQLEENIHRKDLTALEEAVSYRRLIDTNPTKHSAESIATRIGMSVGYVWDRLKLNDLIPEAKRILEAGLMTVGHAILIARLKPADQKRAIEYDDDRSTQYRGVGLWRDDAGFDYDSSDADRKKNKYAGLKPCSVRELEAWIRDHVRFDVEHAAQAQPLTFETTAVEVAAAAAKPGRGKKVIAITHEYRVADDAREDGERTYGSQSWKRADGQEKSKTCEHSVLGVVVAGEDYGSTLQVCVARDKCRVHFGDVLRQKEPAAKDRASGRPAKAAKREQNWEAEQQKRREADARLDARWKIFLPALRKAVSEVRGRLKTLNGPLYAKVLKDYALPASTKPADLPLALLDRQLRNNFQNPHMWRGHEPRLVEWAKALGIDVKALEPKVEKPAAAGAPKAKAGKKR